MNKKFVAIPTLLLCALLVALFVEQANAYCCKVSGWPMGHPPHCNIFGCNCECLQCVNAVEKGCCLAEKSGLMSCSNSRKRRHVLPKLPKQHVEAKELFQQADTDRDGALSMAEAVNYLVSNWNMTKGELTSPERNWFAEIDMNQNEKLEPNEIDEALTL